MQEKGVCVGAGFRIGSLKGRWHPVFLGTVYSTCALSPTFTPVSPEGWAAALGLEKPLIFLPQLCPQQYQALDKSREIPFNRVPTPNGFTQGLGGMTGPSTIWLLPGQTQPGPCFALCSRPEAQCISRGVNSTTHGDPPAGECRGEACSFTHQAGMCQAICSCLSRRVLLANPVFGQHRPVRWVAPCLCLPGAPTLVQPSPELSRKFLPKQDSLLKSFLFSEKPFPCCWEKPRTPWRFGQVLMCQLMMPRQCIMQDPCTRGVAWC